MSCDSGKMPKPVMQGLLLANIKRNVPMAIVGGILAGIAFQTFYVNRKKRIYANFHKNYDIDKEFERMRTKGLFDSCDPNE